MTFAKLESDDGDILSEINMVPLIDVMLVLLIVFIVTLPVVRHAVSVDLPQASSQPGRDQPETVRLSVDAQGRYHWNQEMLSDEALQARLDTAATRQPQPELQIHGDRAVRYERVAQAMAAAQRAGIRRMGFATQP